MNKGKLIQDVIPPITTKKKVQLKPDEEALLITNGLDGYAMRPFTDDELKDFLK